MPIVNVSLNLPEGLEVAADNAILIGQPLMFPGQATFAISVRETWKWPSWLKAAYIAQDADGEWFAFENKPKCGNVRWSHNGGMWTSLPPTLFDIKLPHCDDFRQSLRQNPNTKAG